jgi:endonuclease YncB( thermonuclease family)
MSRLIGLLSVLALLVGGLLLTGPTAQAVDYDCGDFDNQAQAQKHLTPGDPNRLDADHDGIACDSLPCPCSSKQPDHQPAQSTPAHHGTVRQGARIVRVVDGDTVVVRLNHGRQRYVRLLGIDAPEISGGAECYGRAAKARLRGILPVGTRVRLVSDPTQARVDRYGRLLRYVMKGKVDADRRMVGIGAAKVYVYGGKAFARVKGYRGAQRSARLADRGLWGACD